MPSTTIIWQTEGDENVCPICKGLNGYPWTFTAAEGVPDILIHPTFGVVWIVGIGSQAHGHANFNCRCKFQLSINYNDIKKKISVLMNEVQSTVHYSVFSHEDYL